jgi:tRNA 5-methylaminomethyl-2-thiouridine biosynthesis bifunctional protein
MAEALVAPTKLPIKNIQGRVSFRCSTRDYLPIIGPVADTPAMTTTFAAYKRNKYATIDQAGNYHRNLFINVGHGSRGLAYTPLAAEILASVISGEPLPIDEQLYRQLHPARFTIRDLVRNKI